MLLPSCCLRLVGERGSRYKCACSQMRSCHVPDAFVSRPRCVRVSTQMRSCLDPRSLRVIIYFYWTIFTCAIRTSFGCSETSALSFSEQQKIRLIRSRFVSDNGLNGFLLPLYPCIGRGMWKFFWCVSRLPSLSSFILLHCLHRPSFDFRACGFASLRHG